MADSGQMVAHKKQQQLLAEERRLKIAEMMRAGLRGNEIARKLEISAAAVSKHQQQILEDLKARRLDMSEAYLAMELERLDALQVAHWQKAMNGDLAATDRVLKIMEQRAKLLCLYAPAKIALTDPSGEREYSGGGFAALLAEARTLQG